jgi:hypothetical protein
VAAMQAPPLPLKRYPIKTGTITIMGMIILMRISIPTTGIIIMAMITAMIITTVTMGICISRQKA